MTAVLLSVPIINMIGKYYWWELGRGYVCGEFQSPKVAFEFLFGKRPRTKQGKIQKQDFTEYFHCGFTQVYRKAFGWQHFRKGGMPSFESTFYCLASMQQMPNNLTQGSRASIPQKCSMWRRLQLHHDYLLAKALQGAEERMRVLGMQILPGLRSHWKKSFLTSHTTDTRLHENGCKQVSGILTQAFRKTVPFGNVSSRLPNADVYILCFKEQTGLSSACSPCFGQDALGGRGCTQLSSSSSLMRSRLSGSVSRSLMKSSRMASSSVSSRRTFSRW